MTDSAIQRKLAEMAVDIQKLKKTVRINAVVEKARARLRTEIMKGLESGPATDITPAFWKKKRALIERIASKRK